MFNQCKADTQICCILTDALVFSQVLINVDKSASPQVR